MVSSGSRDPYPGWVATPRSAVRSVDQGLQSRCQFVRQFQTPRFINESHADQVAEMRSVVVAERCEFHAHDRVEAQNAERFPGFRLDIRRFLTRHLKARQNGS